MRLYVRRGGKRIRPQLAMWTYRHASDCASDDPAPALLDVAVAWELFHAFLLIHDDIIDGADQRRASPSLHRQLEGLDSDSPRFGMNLGIVAGDLMYAASHRVLADLDVSAEAYRELHRLFAQVAALTGFGQAIDILQSHTPLGECDEQTLLREYHWKTAAYTFEGPMLSAAILAGLGTPAREAISRFALSLGQAYQLQNDLIDLSRPASEGCDLVEGKRTITLLRARAAMASGARSDFDQRVATIQRVPAARGIALAETLRRDLLATDAVKRSQETIDDLLAESIQAAIAPAIPEPLRQAMQDLLCTLRRQYFASTANP